MKMIDGDGEDYRIFLGSTYGYSDKEFTLEEVVQVVATYQHATPDQPKQDFYVEALACSVRINPTTYVFRDYVEKGWEIVVAQYPPFPKEEAVRRKFAEGLVWMLMEAFKQERITMSHGSKHTTYERVK